MIKLIIYTVLCIALSGPVLSKISEKRIGDDGYHLIVDLDDNRPCEDKCLATKNSKKISDAILHVLHKAKNSYDVLADLMIIEFIYDQIDYKEWAENIKNNDFEYEGYEKLQNLVKRYKVCQKVCKVYSQLRKALRQHAGAAKMYENDSPDGSKDIEIVGDLCILEDFIDDLERFISQDRAFQRIVFHCPIFIADTNLKQEKWTGMDVQVNADLTVVPRQFVSWDVTALKRKYL